MASFKALCLVGVASFAVTAPAFAADLALPPPPPVFEPAPAPSFGGNWYLRGDTGLAIADLRKRSSTLENADVLVPDLRNENSSLDDSGFIDVGVGYRFNNYIRADVTGEYRGAAHFAANESYNIGYFAVDQYGNPAQSAARAYDNYGGNVRSIVGLVNGYVDVGTWYGLTPFIGAGVGVANIRVGSVTDISYGSGIGDLGNGGGGFSSPHSQTNFAFALMAGLDFAVTQNLTMELGYRYLNLGTASTGAIICQPPSSTCPLEVQKFKLASNDIRLGFRYAFSDVVPYQQRPPIIARY